MVDRPSRGRRPVQIGNSLISSNVRPIGSFFNTQGVGIGSTILGNTLTALGQSIMDNKQDGVEIQRELEVLRTVEEYEKESHVRQETFLQAANQLSPQEIYQQNRSQQENLRDDYATIRFSDPALRNEFLKKTSDFSLARVNDGLNAAATSFTNQAQADIESVMNSIFTKSYQRPEMTVQQVEDKLIPLLDGLEQIDPQGVLKTPALQSQAARYFILGTQKHYGTEAALRALEGGEYPFEFNMDDRLKLESRLRDELEDVDDKYAKDAAKRFESFMSEHRKSKFSTNTDALTPDEFEAYRKNPYAKPDIIQEYQNIAEIGSEVLRTQKILKGLPDRQARKYIEALNPEKNPNLAGKDFNRNKQLYDAIQKNYEDFRKSFNEDSVGTLQSIAGETGGQVSPRTLAQAKYLQEGGMPDQAPYFTKQEAEEQAQGIVAALQSKNIPRLTQLLGQFNEIPGEIAGIPQAKIAMNQVINEAGKSGRVPELAETAMTLFGKVPSSTFNEMMSVALQDNNDFAGASDFLKNDLNFALQANSKWKEVRQLFLSIPGQTGARAVTTQMETLLRRAALNRSTDDPNQAINETVDRFFPFRVYSRGGSMFTLPQSTSFFDDNAIEQRLPEIYSSITQDSSQLQIDEASINEDFQSLMRAEGGLNPDDGNGTPSKYGVNWGWQQNNPVVKQFQNAENFAQNFSLEDARRFWDAHPSVGYEKVKNIQDPGLRRLATHVAFGKPAAHKFALDKRLENADADEMTKDAMKSIYDSYINLAVNEIDRLTDSRTAQTWRSRLEKIRDTEALPLLDKYTSAASATSRRIVHENASQNIVAISGPNLENVYFYYRVLNDANEFTHIPVLTKQGEHVFVTQGQLSNIRATRGTSLPEAFIGQGELPSASEQLKSITDPIMNGINSILGR